MSKTLLTTTGLLAGLAAFLAVNLLADRTLTSARADLTENHLYTVSDGAKRVMAGLSEPVTLRYYYSESVANDIPNIRGYAQRVRGLLEEFAASSGGKVTLEVIDPEPFSDTEDAAVAAGIAGQPVNEAGDLLYFGLQATGSTDQHEEIAFLDPRREESLEYEVTRIISRLGHPDRKVLAVVSALPLSGRQAMPWQGGGGEEPYYLFEEMQQEYDVHLVQPGATELPKDTELLLVAHPKGISDELLYAVDQFVLKGGHALFFVDPYCETDRPPADPNDPMSQFTAERSSNLGRIFEAWGLEMKTGVFAGDRGTALTLPAGERKQPIAHVWYEQLKPENFNSKDIVTAGVQSILLSTPGILTRKDGATIELDPLVQTSPDAEELQTSTVQFMPDASKILAEFVPSGQPFTIAARVHGTVKTAFPEGRPAPDKKQPGEDADAPPAATPDPGFVAESKEPINVVVVADADLLHDAFWVSKQRLFGNAGPAVAMVRNGNGDFVMAALDNLAGSNDLISVRPRASFDRPFERIDAIRKDAEQKFAANEQALEAQLHDLEGKLSELEGAKKGGDEMILSPEQRAEIEQFQQQRLETRKKLRDVQFDLRRDIDHVETMIKVVNIGLVPALLCVAALALLGWRRQRRA
jgi:ABC-type uncharacterized transport system involved in gliding motility auxiliary subunit